MSIKHANESNFKEMISEGITLVDFYADWCGPCRMLAPILEEVANENPEYKIVKVNVDENRELAMEMEVMGIPALFLFANGKKVDNKAGLMSKEDIITWFKSQS